MTNFEIELPRVSWITASVLCATVGHHDWRRLPPRSDPSRRPMPNRTQPALCPPHGTNHCTHSYFAIRWLHIYTVPKHVLLTRNDIKTTVQRSRHVPSGRFATTLLRAGAGASSLSSPMTANLERPDALAACFLATVQEQKDARVTSDGQVKTGHRCQSAVDSAGKPSLTALSLHPFPLLVSLPLPPMLSASGGNKSYQQLQPTPEQQLSASYSS